MGDAREVLAREIVDVLLQRGVLKNPVPGNLQEWREQARDDLGAFLERHAPHLDVDELLGLAARNAASHDTSAEQDKMQELKRASRYFGAR